jgi:hypothetical protein
MKSHSFRGIWPISSNFYLWNVTDAVIQTSVPNVGHRHFSPLEVLSMSYAWDSTGSVPPHCWGADWCRGGDFHQQRYWGVKFQKSWFYSWCFVDGQKHRKFSQRWSCWQGLVVLCDLIWISTIHILGIPPSSSTCCDDTRFCALLIWLGGQGVSWNGGRDYRWFQFKYPIWGNRVFIKPGSHRWVFLKSCGCQKKNTRFPLVKVPQKSPFDLDNWGFFRNLRIVHPQKGAPWK